MGGKGSGKQGTPFTNSVPKGKAPKGKGLGRAIPAVPMQDTRLEAEEVRAVWMLRGCDARLLGVRGTMVAPRLL